MKKIVLNLYLHDERDKQKAMKAVSSISGVKSIAMDMKGKKLTVIGDVDPVCVVVKLRKKWHAEILTVGLVEEPEKKKDECKKDEKKRDERKENEEKKDEGKKDEDKKKEEEKQIAELVKAYKAYNPWMTQHYYVQSAEENPNACVVY